MIIKNVTHNEVFDLSKALQPQDGKVTNLTLVARDSLTLCFMAVGAGEEIGTHAAPGDAFVQLQSGEATITVGDKVHQVKAGQGLIMPAGIPHSLKTDVGFSMLLTLVKEGK